MAYTKYSLTPANNTAAPPDGAPEGMLPSAVNDTMRDMMAQIRDCGDGIRDGTYTMTAPKITGGTITGATFTGNTFSNPIVTGVSTFAAGTVSAPAITTTGDTNTGIFFPAADTIAFTEGGVESMRIDSSGNVGIGATTNTAKLTIKNPNASGEQSIFVIQSAASTGDIAKLSFNQSTDEFKIATSTSTGFLTFATSSGTERMRIDSSGNLLVGTTSATYSSATRGLIELNGSSTSLFAFKKGGTASAYIQSATNFEIQNVNNSAMTFATNDTERMRINSDGHLLIGKTAPSNSSAGVELNNNGFSVQTTVTTGDGPGFQYVNGSASSPSGYRFASFRIGTSATQIGTITQNGTTAVAYNTTSDYRLKENIAPMTGALAKVQALKPVTYKWKADGSDGQGFIAHELQAVVPDCVTGEKDGEQMQGIDTSFLVATLTAAIQELKAELDATKAEVQALKGV
jgi:hypothetical protein